MGTKASESNGYSEASLEHWAARAHAWASGSAPNDMEYVEAGSRKDEPRDVFLYVISGHKVHNPAAAMSLIKRLG
jgi:uncharacterized protein YecE (DUF72 family)